MTGSIRWRLFGLAAASILLALVVTGGALVVIFKDHLQRRVAQDLEVRWAELARAFDLDPTGTPVLRREMSDPRYVQPYGGAYWQIGQSGKPALRSRSLWDFELSTEAIPESARRAAFKAQGPNGSRLFVVERAVLHEVGGETRPFVLLVALDYAEIAELSDAFTQDVAKLLALLVVVLVLGGAAQLHFGLQPFERLRVSLSLLREGRASRLDGAFPVEVAPLADELNRLLDQQDKLIEKARSRAGSLAHGLKTPLTILNGEIGRLQESGQSEVAAVLSEQCEAIRVHVERELAKARTHGAINAPAAATEVRPMLERLVDLMRRIDTDDRIAWKVSAPEGLTSRLEAGDFAEVVGNLLDNARKWARSRVEVSCETQEGEWRLTVADDGPGVEAALREDMLKRGVRAANAPSGSTGLGLSIVTDALAEYGLALTVDATPSGCRISFPLAPPETAPGEGESWRPLARALRFRRAPRAR